jgi:catechol 2,3-dioxygenase-like lactoylglutathione lyase family enzyme
MSQTAIGIKKQKYDTGAARVDMKLEVQLIPVSDVDRAKEFYGKLGWRLDADDSVGNDVRIVQFTPPGSASSVSFGKGITAAAPGSAEGALIVSDIVAAHDELVGRGIDASDVWHGAPVARSHRSRNDHLCISKRSGKRHPARRSRPRRAREAQRAARRELAGLVRSVHGGRAGRD